MRRVVLALVVAFAAPAAARAEPPHTHEIIYNRPSGFWTSNLPAKGGAYRYRLLGIGGGIALLTLALVLRAIKRANADRAAAATNSGR